MTTQELLSILLALDGKKFCAYCPELYLVTEMDAHHLPYINAIFSFKTDWELRMLIEIKHGLVQV